MIYSLQNEGSDARDHKGALTGDGLWFDGDFSVDGGNTYTTHKMKHSTGSGGMGVPEHLLHQHTLHRCLDHVVLTGPMDTKPHRANKYQDLYFRVAGLVTRTDVIQIKSKQTASCSDTLYYGDTRAL